MNRSIRGRLQWWYGAVYALSIIVFGTLVYWRADRDVHERATLQAVTTSQYLDVSLRNLDPGVLRNPEPLNVQTNTRGQSSDDFHSELRIGPLPPEFRFRPPRVGPPRRGMNGPPRSPNSILKPVSDLRGEPDERREPLDRLEFSIWRADGVALMQSDGFRIDSARSFRSTETIGSAPDVAMVSGTIDVLKRGPHGIVIQVQRPIEHDMANLYRFGLQIAAMASGTLVFGLIGGWWISGRIVQPIRRISDTAAQISATSLNRRIETRSLDAELVQLGEMLNGAFERLEQSFGRLTQFTADASHELRTPLAVIQSQVELALSQPRTAESYRQTLEVCLKSSDRMRQLTDGLLLLARTDSDRLELRPVTIDLRQVAEEAVAQLHDRAISAGVEIDCTTSESEVLISGDPRFLTQVPTNLLDNAIQHSVGGGRVHIEVRVDGLEAVLTVQDAGCGIPAEHLTYIYDRFYRVDMGRSRKHGGSGLGLAICRSLIEAHGGTISCESTVGEGSKFCVRLPLKAAPPGVR